MILVTEGVDVALEKLRSSAKICLDGCFRTRRYVHLSSQRQTKSLTMPGRDSACLNLVGSSLPLELLCVP
jgi:hypothetical protein